MFRHFFFYTSTRFDILEVSYTSKKNYTSVVLHTTTARRFPPPPAEVQAPLPAPDEAPARARGDLPGDPARRRAGRARIAI